MKKKENHIRGHRVPIIQKDYVFNEEDWNDESKNKSQNTFS